jgi:hypothetical protein
MYRRAMPVVTPAPQFLNLATGAKPEAARPASPAATSFWLALVRKKLGLTLQSDKPDGERVYRVIEPQAA